MPGVKIHPVLLPNNTLLKLVHARVFAELPAAEEENWIKLLNKYIRKKMAFLSFTISIMRLAKVSSTSLTERQKHLAVWKLLFSPAILVRWKKPK